MSKRTWSFLRWGLVALTAGLVTAATAAPGRALALATDAARDAAPQQAPPVRERITKISLAINGGDVIRIVVTNDSAPTGSSYANWTEYWSMDRDTSIEKVSSLELTSWSEQQPSEKDILGYLVPTKSWGPEVSWAQVIGSAGWTRGVYKPASAQYRLFSAEDPDDATRRIGLLIEQGKDGALERMTFYKSSSATGTIFGATPEKLAFKQVVDSKGQPSVDPADIDPTATWYYATGP